MVPLKEIIKFQLDFHAEFWDKPPHLKILLNDKLFFNNVLNHGLNTLQFEESLDFKNTHRLEIIRSGKDNKQFFIDSTGKKLDQVVVLEKVVIDGINIRDIILSKSHFAPEYPEPWASQQLAAGNKLIKEIVGCTTFGHNGTLQFEFTSPFYEYIMQWMGGGLR